MHGNLHDLKSSQPRPKMGRIVAVLCVHSGPFHADDVAFTTFVSAVFKLRGYKVKIIRTRNPEKIAEADVVGDVGGMYDPMRGRFDHHQHDFFEARPNGVPYASAGLAWKEFGREYLQGQYGLFGYELEHVWERVDRDLVSGIDALDVRVLNRPIPSLESRPTVIVPTGSISQAIAALNPVPGIDPINDEEYRRRFMVAVSTMRMILENFVKRALLVETWSSIVKEQDRGGPILVVDRATSDSSPAFGPQVSKRQHIKLVVYRSADGESWRVSTVYDEFGASSRRAEFPEAWGGQSPEELNSLIGINDAIFCHPKLWIAGAGSRESAIKMAELALEKCS